MGEKNNKTKKPHACPQICSGFLQELEVRGWTGERKERKKVFEKPCELRHKDKRTWWCCSNLVRIQSRREETDGRTDGRLTHLHTVFVVREKKKLGQDCGGRPAHSGTQDL